MARRSISVLGWGALLAGAIAGCGGPGAANPAPGGQGSVTLNVPLRATEYRLPNGLEVVLHEDRSLPTATVDVRYHVGGRDDPRGRSGFAHLFEHLMFLGSKNVGERQLSQLLEEAGAREFNAFTTDDVTEYYEVMPPSELPTALWLEAERMAHPVERVDEAAFRRERDVVKNEWRERYDDAPYGALQRILREATFPEEHPYRRPPIGSPEDLDRASLDEARAFAARYYRPGNATLVIVGNFDTAVARPLIDRLFGGIPGGVPIEPRLVPFPRLASDRRVEVVADVDAPRVVFAWPVPPPYAPGYYEVQFAAGQIAGWTRYKLETESEIARSVEWEIAPGRLGSLLTVSVQLAPNADPGAAVTALETRVGWAARLGTLEPWPEFGDRRTQRMTHHVMALAAGKARAHQIQEYVEFFGHADAAQDDLRAIQATRASSVGSAAEELLGDAKVVVVVKPQRGAPRHGQVVR